MNRLSVLLITALLFTGCGSQQEQPAVDTDQPATDSITATDDLLYRETAEMLVQRFSSSLYSELATALKEGTAEAALGICSTTTSSFARALAPGNWSIRRVTDKFRNPNNRTDSSQLLLLAAFTDTSGQLPEFTVDWFGPDSARTFRYYQPIGIGQLCLKCHGDLQTLAPGMFKTLKRRYPLDRAIGYRPGDLRGMYMVEAAWPDGKEFAEKLLSGALDIDSLLADSLLADSLQPDSLLVDSLISDTALSIDSTRETQ